MSIVVDIRPTAPPAEIWLSVVASLADELASTAPGDVDALRDRLESMLGYELADRIEGDKDGRARNELLRRLIDCLARRR